MPNLQEVIESGLKIKFEFVSVQMDETQDRQPIMRLILKDPIPKVLGRRVFEGGGQRMLEAENVQVVSILPDGIKQITELEKAGNVIFKWNEVGKSGTVESGKVKLDISRRSNDVFLVVEPLGSANRQQQGNSRIGDLLKKIADDAAKQLPKPEVVA